MSRSAEAARKAHEVLEGTNKFSSMKTDSNLARKVFSRPLVAVLCWMMVAPATLAQQRYARTFAVAPRVRVQVVNLSGRIVVEGWGRNEVKVTANTEAPPARIVPETGESAFVINVVQVNRGREIGDVNFLIFVPTTASVDLETKRGDITVRGIRGQMVRARVSTEGDIELTDISTAMLMAENTMGDILFDGDLLPNGSYTLASMQGNINIRIPADAAFRLNATAPLTRNINLGEFARLGLFSFMSGNRKVIGKTGDGRALLNVFNQGGPIIFTRR